MTGGGKDGWTGRERDLASREIDMTGGISQAARDGAADAILADLRDRKLLKYLFDAEPEICGAYGYVEQPIDLETQREIALALTDIAFAKAIADERERCAGKADERERELRALAADHKERGLFATCATIDNKADLAANIATAIRATGGEGGR